MTTLEKTAVDAGLVRKVGEVGELADRLQGLLIGLPYLFGRASYGEELTLHFGKERGFNNGKLAGKLRGTHVLRFRASPWVFQPGTHDCFIAHRCSVPEDAGGKPFPFAAFESGAMVVPGSTVNFVRPLLNERDGVIGLRLGLSDGTVIFILPDPPDSDLSAYEVLTPDGMLSVGPGIGWSWEPNDSR